MAEAAINRFIPSGYDEDFVFPPDEDLHCIICQLPSKEAVLTKCGHRFCQECLEEHLRRYLIYYGKRQCSKLKKKTGCPYFKSRATKPVNSVALMNPWLPVRKPHIFSALHKKHPFLSS